MPPETEGRLGLDLEWLRDFTPNLFLLGRPDDEVACLMMLLSRL